jgi:hypothetical protein
VWLAASISIKSIDFPAMISWQLSHLLQGSPFFEFWQFMALAKILAIDVLPDPLGPQNKYACEMLPELMEFTRVCTTCCCPTTSPKVCGLYFLYKTKFVVLFVVIFIF